MQNCDWQPHVATAARWECFFPAGQLSVCWWATWCLKSILSTNSGFPLTITVVMLWGDVVLIRDFRPCKITMLSTPTVLNHRCFSPPPFIHARLTVFNFFVEDNLWSVNLIVWAENNIQTKQGLELKCRPAIRDNVITVYSNWTRVFLEHAARKQN